VLQNRFLYDLCVVLLDTGMGLLIAAVQDVGGVVMNPPWLIGVDLATIGGLGAAALDREDQSA
jgi:hypothetical protein